MHYVKQFNINGVDTRQVACIESKGKPNAATEACVGALCIDVTSPLHDVYKCVAVNGSIYTWELLSSGLSIVSSSVSGKGADTVQFAYADLRTPLTYLLKSGDLILDAEGYLYQVESINTTYCVGTYLGVNLTASTHTHPATDIDRGTLSSDRLPVVPIEKGGTNANTLQEAKDNLGISEIEQILNTYFYGGTQGLAYELDGDTYVCTGIGTATDNQIVIASKVDGKAVTSIGEDAFFRNENIVSVVIQKGVQSIGDNAFSMCSLSYINLPNSVTSIGWGAFGNSDLTSVTIPNSVVNLGEYSLSDCNNLETVVLPNNITEISECLLMRCPKLSSVSIPQNVTSIGIGAFWQCESLTSISIPNKVTSIGNTAFAQSGLTSITIPNSVTSIGPVAFGGCPNLKKITIDNVKGAIPDSPWGAEGVEIEWLRGE